MDRNELKNKILGCWYGKNIGGTLGAPFEWRRQINHVTGYTQNLDGNPMPNDDLDIQLLWLITLEEQKLQVTTRDLGYYFSVCVTPHWAEYGNAKANMKLGICSPQSGRENNPYIHSCGSYIRSEIWACIAAGNPELAVSYMLADSAIDHSGNSEGTYAAALIVAMEAAAFVEKDVNKLLDIGLGYIPSDCGVAQAAALVRACYAKGMPYLDTRDEILRRFRGAPFSYYDGKETVVLCSDRDKELGFADGEKGYDAVDNIAIVVLGLLYGQGDFSDTLCYAVNCGEDTDCTAATLGSLLGIIYGYDGIPNHWIRPIGNAIKTLCLDHGELEGMIPQTVEELTERTLALIDKSVAVNGLGIYGENVDPSALYASRTTVARLFGKADSCVYDYKFFKVSVSYPNGQYLKDGVGVAEIEVENKFRVSENLSYRWYTDDGCSVDDKEGFFYLARNTYGNPIKKMFFEFTCPTEKRKCNFVFSLDVEGRAATMLVPVLFLKGAK